jgi:hypothetical protein
MQYPMLFVVGEKYGAIDISPRISVALADAPCPPLNSESAHDNSLSDAGAVTSSPR